MTPPLPRTELWLIRHGESEANARGVLQGHFDSPLSAQGREEAALLAARLAVEPPDRLYSSDLVRALETAEAIGAACALPVQQEARLREIAMGTWSNRKIEEVRTTLSPEEWARFKGGDPHFRRGGEESMYALRARMVAIIEEIVAGEAGKRVAIVSHGAALRAYLSHLLEIPLQRSYHLLPVRNSSLTRVAPPEAGQPGRLLLFNDVSHLQAWASIPSQEAERVAPR